MQVRFKHSSPDPRAHISLPSSKSLSHRALICASLAKGDSLIRGITESKDTKATMAVMECFGAGFEYTEEGILVHGCGGNLHAASSTADCNESGSTLRFLIPIAGLLKEESVFEGHGRLMDRPQDVYETIFAEQGLVFRKEGSQLHVAGPLAGGTYKVRGDISSQFISGLLFALPLCREDSVIEILPPFESASYVRLTLDALEKAGIQVEMEGLQIRIAGNQTYQPFETVVEGDDSQCAFFAEMALVHHTECVVENLNHDSHQGDHVILDIVKDFGGQVEEVENGYRFSATDLHACDVDLADCPDLGPALFALATQAEGTTVFHNCARLRIKESDRIAAMEEELRKLGCTIDSDENTVRVTGPSKIADHAALYGHNDHRIVMALSMLASLADGITIDGAEAIAKSYPGFFEDLGKAGIRYDQ